MPKVKTQPKPAADQPKPPCTIFLYDKELHFVKRSSKSVRIYVICDDQDQKKLRAKAYALNKYYEDIVLKVGVKQKENVDISKTVPFTILLPPDMEKETSIYDVNVIDEFKKTVWRVYYHGENGNPDAECDGTLFTLPFPKGKKYRCTQGFNGPETHNDLNRYAVDFDMKEGETVAAAREGVVVEALDKFKNSDTNPSHANVVTIRHKDGTYASYGHIQKDTARPRFDEGDEVNVGAEIALSGKTGSPRGPHLHFAVGILNKQRKFQTLPWKFKDNKGTPFEPIEGEEYTNE